MPEVLKPIAKACGIAVRHLFGLRVAALYVLLGAIGLALAIPPGYASPVFPAAGLALAATLHYGPRVLPHIGLASFVLNLGHSLHADLLPLNSLLAASGIAGGVMLQAACGYWWVVGGRGKVWQRQEGESRIVGLLIRGGVLACLVSSSVAVTVLWLVQLIALEAVPLSWWTWYTGDLLGVAIFAPLALLFFAPDSELARERRQRILMPICIALGLSLCLYAGAAHLEDRQIQARVKQAGAVLANQIQDRLITQEAVLASLKHFAEANPDFTYRQFLRFTEAALADYPDLFALSFNDAVGQARLRDDETEIGGSSPDGVFRATGGNSRTEVVSLADREQYAIVRYVTPRDGKAPAVGPDLHSDPMRRDAIQRIRASGQAAVTPPIRLLHEHARRSGVLLLAPVFRSGGAAAKDPSGYALAVLKVDELIEIATRGRVPPGLHFRVVDSDVPDDAGQFYRSSAHADAGSGSAYRWRTPLAIADRQWMLDVWPDASYGQQNRHWISWAIGVVALLFTGLLQIHLHGMTEHVLLMRRQNAALLQKQAELQLAETVYENTADAIVVTDTTGRIISINSAFTQITGYELAEVQGKLISVLSSGHHGPVFYETMWKQLLAQNKWRGELINRRKNGEKYVEALTITAVTDGESKVIQYVGTFSDITDQKSAREQIEFLAYHDALTGLPNRVSGKEHADGAIARARRHGHQIGVVFMDIDNFKLINDTYGHSTGDQLLRLVAERLRNNVRVEDALCRLSGDEFMLILGHAREAADLAASCEHVLAALKAPYQIAGRLVTTSLSAGVATYPADGESAEELLRNADTALFEAKRAGRNTYRFFNADMNQRVVAFVETRDALIQAIRRGEFTLVYQPQIRLRDGAVVGVEALIRWRHPLRGLLALGQFIPVAEQSGLIVQIGAWVMQEACRQMRSWIDEGLCVQTVAVNLSAIQFKSGDIGKTIIDALAAARLAPEYLELELTESILISDQDEMLARVAELKAKGLRLAIDDFGTGYSSMAYLKRFKADKIKIDASFAARVAEDPDDAAIVRSIIQMAQALGLETTAEGIEQAENIAVLKAMGCTNVQGYFYARPLAAPELADWLRNYPATTQGDATPQKPSQPATSV